MQNCPADICPPDSDRLCVYPIRRRQTAIVSAGFPGGAGRFLLCKKHSLHEGAAGSEATSDGVQNHSSKCSHFGESVSSYFARSMYSPVRVSIRIISPVLMNSGTCREKPVSRVAGL